MNEEVENKKEKRKQIRLAIVGVVALLLLTLSATFAYFMINTTSSSSKAKIDVDVEAVDSIALKEVTSDLHINLNAADMAMANQNTEYFGDDAEENNYVKTLEEGIHNLGKLTATGGNGKTRYMCSANAVITMQVANETDMGKYFQPGDAYLYLSAGSLNERIDLSELSSTGTKTIPLSIGIQSESERILDGYVEIINTSADQTYLADRTLNIDVTFQDLDCNVGVSKVETYLRSKDTDNKLTEDKVSGMYRYQGNSILSNYDVVEGTFDREDIMNSNYICLGADCNATGKDLYRIIGVTEDGLLKVVKNTPANDSIAWNSDYQSDIKWPQSELYQYLNNEFYNTLSIDLKEMIVDSEWKYGDINSYYDSEYQNVFTSEELEKYNTLYDDIYEKGLSDEEIRPKIKEITKLESEAMIKTEEKATSKISSKVSLMSLTDYCSSFESDKEINCMTSWYYDSLSGLKETDYGVSWLTPQDNWYWEWTMSRSGFSGSNYFAWIVRAGGGADGNDLSSENAARPVFYLKSDLEISGAGTIDSPFRTGIE